MKHLGSSFLRESLSHISYARRQARRRVRHASGLPILSAPRFSADLVRAHNYITRSPPRCQGLIGRIVTTAGKFPNGGFVPWNPFRISPEPIYSVVRKKKN